jgi:hypothetical protein
LHNTVTCYIIVLIMIRLAYISGTTTEVVANPQGGRPGYARTEVEIRPFPPTWEQMKRLELAIRSAITGSNFQNRRAGNTVRGSYDADYANGLVRVAATANLPQAGTLTEQYARGREMTSESAKLITDQVTSHALNALVRFIKR